MSSLCGASLSTGVTLPFIRHKQYINFSSCHPTSTKGSIPYSLAVKMIAQGSTVQITMRDWQCKGKTGFKIFKELLQKSRSEWIHYT